MTDNGLRFSGLSTIAALAGSLIGNVPIAPNPSTFPSQGIGANYYANFPAMEMPRIETNFSGYGFGWHSYCEEWRQWNPYFDAFIRACARNAGGFGPRHNRAAPALVRRIPGLCAKRKAAMPPGTRAIKRAVRNLLRA